MEYPLSTGVSSYVSWVDFPPTPGMYSRPIGVVKAAIMGECSISPDHPFFVIGLSDSGIHEALKMRTPMPPDELMPPGSKIISDFVVRAFFDANYTPLVCYGFPNPEGKSVQEISAVSIGARALWLTLNALNEGDDRIVLKGGFTIEFSPKELASIDSQLLLS